MRLTISKRTHPAATFYEVRLTILPDGAARVEVDPLFHQNMALNYKTDGVSVWFIRAAALDDAIKNMSNILTPAVLKP